MQHLHFPTTPLRGLAPEAGDLAALSGLNRHHQQQHVNLGEVLHDAGALASSFATEGNQASVKWYNLGGYKVNRGAGSQDVAAVTGSDLAGVDLVAQDLQRDVAGPSECGKFKPLIQVGKTSEQPVQINGEGQASGLPVNFRSGTHTAPETAGGGNVGQDALSASDQQP